MVLVDEVVVGGNVLMIEEIVMWFGVLKCFLEYIMLELCNVGYVGLWCGWVGGYVLIKMLKEILILELLWQVDGLIVLLFCLLCWFYQCCEDCMDEVLCCLCKMFGQVFWFYLLLIESLIFVDLVEEGGLFEMGVV